MSLKEILLVANLAETVDVSKSLILGCNDPVTQLVL